MPDPSNKTSLNELKIDRTPARRRPWPYLAIAAGLVAAGALFLWIQTSAAIPVRTERVLERAANGDQPLQTTVLNASGYVTARREATVSSKTTGRIVDVLVEEGMKVKEGQVLARLDDSNVSKSLALANAQLQSAKAAVKVTQVRLDEAKKDYHRISQLATDRVASLSDRDQAEATMNAYAAQLNQQKADVQVAERQVALYQQEMEDLIIRAPFDGVVVTKNAQPGEMISPLSAGGAFTRTGICTIVDMHSLEIEVDVNEAYINRVSVDQKVVATLDAYPDWKIPGKVIAIIPTADRQKATVKVRIAFDHLDPRILPDMGIKVAFRESERLETGKQMERILTIPKAALRQDSGRDVVFVVQDGHARRRPVRVGGQEGNRVVILSGLVAGEAVVVSGPDDLKDGQAVKRTQS